MGGGVCNLAPGTVKHHQESCWFSAVYSNEPWLSQPLHMLFPLPGHFPLSNSFVEIGLKATSLGEASPSPKIGLRDSCHACTYLSTVILPHTSWAPRGQGQHCLFISLGVVLSSQPAGARCPTCSLNK